MSAEGWVAIITAIMTPISAMFYAWLRLAMQGKASLARIERVVIDIQDKQAEYSDRLTNVETHVGLRPAPATPLRRTPSHTGFEAGYARVSLMFCIAMVGCAALPAIGAALPFIRKTLDIIERVMPIFGVQSAPVSAARAACSVAKAQADTALQTTDTADDDEAARAGQQAIDELDAALRQ